MGQATSLTAKNKPNVFDNPNDFSSRFSKATISALALPMVIVAFPLLNAYSFTEEEFTGMVVMDGVIGGLLGVVGWPLAPFLAFWGVLQVIFNDTPPEPNPVPQEIKTKARREIGLNCDQYYNVAVVGAAGTGKSSLINGIMGYHDEDVGAAVTGEIEATAVPRAYKHPDLSSMILWDMPGAGTTSHRRETYFEDKFLCAFDSLIIVLAERLSEIDVELAKKAQQCQIPVLFVRNKADQAIAAKLRRANHSDPENADIKTWSKAAGELTTEVKQSVYKELKAEKLPTRRLFILSAWRLQDFVTVLKEEKLGKHLKLIDEERFMRKLVEGLVVKRKPKEIQEMKQRKKTQRVAT